MEDVIEGMTTGDILNEDSLSTEEIDYKVLYFEKCKLIYSKKLALHQEHHGPTRIQYLHFLDISTFLSFSENSPSSSKMCLFQENGDNKFLL